MAIRSLCLFLCFLIGCSSGGDERSSSDGGSSSSSCGGECESQKLFAADVETIVAQGAAVAKSLGVGATIAVTDRVGNVLAVAKTPGAVETAVADGAKGGRGGVEGARFAAGLVAISKAGTGAYLSSQGNAFSTATASLIVQEHFLPGEQRAPGGPLFGVQFSQLPCSDLMVLQIPSAGKTSAGGLIGPRPLPLGLSGDPGGFPLYKNGDVVGGVGVEIDGLYTIDTAPREEKQPIEELVALGASRGFTAPSGRTADNIFVGGKSLVYASVGLDDVPAGDPAPEFSLTPIPPFFGGAFRDGALFGTPESGYVKSDRAGVATLTLVNAGGGNRFPTQRGVSLGGGAELKEAEVEAILNSAITVANRARAAIRRPLDSSARVSVFVVDTAGRPIGFVRSADAPVFGTDVSLQKARTALFFSSSAVNGLDGNALARAAARGVPVDGTKAFSSRAIGNLSRPFFPDGIDGSGPGPFSVPFPGEWSPFNTGLQIQLTILGLAAPLDNPARFPQFCTPFGQLIGNGIQIFAGGVPLYRNGVLIGAVGVSGDGIDQDDMIAFYGASRKGLDEAGHTDIGDPVLGFNAPTAVRSDTIEVEGNLRYVNCPEAPFIGSNAKNVCGGL